MSWGTFKWAELDDIPSDCPCPENWIGVGYLAPEHYPEIQTAVLNAIAEGVVCIAAAGNTSKNGVNAKCPNPGLCDPMWIPFDSYPAQYSGVIAVSATRFVNHLTDEFEDTYNWGIIDVSAPGIDIWTTDNDGNYTSLNGTSFSSPIVSALAGLIISMVPDNEGFTVQIIQDIITSTADKIDPSNCPGGGTYDANGWNPCLGYGRINAYAALNLVESLPSTPTGLTLSGSSGNPIILTWNSNPEADIYEYIIYRKDPGSSTYRRIGTAQGTQYTDSDVTVGNKFDPVYCYRITAEDIIGQESNQSSEKCKNGDGPVGKIMILPKEYALHANHPNPFNPRTSIRYNLPEESIVVIKIYDLMGRDIKSIVDGTENAGFKNIMWDGKDKNGRHVPSGMYFYKLDAISKESDKKFARSQKMILMK